MKGSVAEQNVVSCRKGSEKRSFVIKQVDKGKIATVKCTKKVMFGELTFFLAKLAVPTDKSPITCHPQYFDSPRARRTC